MPDTSTATCSNCGFSNNIEIWQRINVGTNPELKSEVKDGSLFVWKCPHCGTLNLARYITLYHDPASRLMIWNCPVGVFPEETEKLLVEQLKQNSEALEGYTTRRVSDTGSLIEKVNIFDSGLDDVIIELCKYVTKMEMTENKDASLKFYKSEGSDNDIVFSFPDNGQMKVLKVGFNVYEDCAGILRRNPEIAPENPFCTVDDIWVSKFFK